MIRIVMSATVRAGPERVWRALTVPGEIVRWSPRLLAAVDVPPDYPRVGQRADWRFRLGGIVLPLEERLLEVTPQRRLRTRLRLGLFPFELTRSLEGDTRGAAPTRIGLRLDASSVLPVVGGVLDRFAVRRFATQWVAGSLEALRAWCDEGRAAGAVRSAGRRPRRSPAPPSAAPPDPGPGC